MKRILIFAIVILLSDILVGETTLSISASSQLEIRSAPTPSIIDPNTDAYYRDKMKGVTDNETVNEIRAEILKRKDLTLERKEQLCHKVTEVYQENLNWSFAAECAKIWGNGIVGMAVQVASAYVPIPGVGGAIDGVGEAIAEGKWTDLNYVLDKATAGAAVDFATFGVGKFLGKSAKKFIEIDVGELVKRIENKIPLDVTKKIGTDKTLNNKSQELTRKLTGTSESKGLYELYEDAGERFGDLMQQFRDVCKNLDIKGKGLDDLTVDEIEKIDKINPTLRQDLVNSEGVLKSLKTQITVVEEEIDELFTQYTLKRQAELKKVIDFLKITSASKDHLVKTLEDITKTLDKNLSAKEIEKLLKERLTIDVEIEKFLDKMLIKDKSKFIDALVKVITNMWSISNDEKSIDDLNVELADRLWDYIFEFIATVIDTIDYERLAKEQIDEYLQTSDGTSGENENVSQTTEGETVDQSSSNDNHQKQTENNGNTGGNDGKKEYIPVNDPANSTPTSEESTPTTEDPSTEQPTPEQPTPTPEQPTPSSEQPTPTPEQPTPTPEQPTTEDSTPTTEPDPNPNQDAPNTDSSGADSSDTTTSSDDSGQDEGSSSSGTKVDPLDPTYDPWSDVWDSMPEGFGDVCEKVLSTAESWAGGQLQKLIDKYPGFSNVLAHLGIDGTGIVRGVVNIVGVLVTSPDLRTALGKLSDMAVNALKQIAIRALQWGVQWLAQKIFGNSLLPKAVNWIDTATSGWVTGMVSDAVASGLTKLQQQISCCAKCAGFKINGSTPSGTSVRFVDQIINNGKKSGQNGTTVFK